MIGCRGDSRRDCTDGDGAAPLQFSGDQGDTMKRSSKTPQAPVIWYKQGGVTLG